MIILGLIFAWRKIRPKESFHLPFLILIILSENFTSPFLSIPVSAFIYLMEDISLTIWLKTRPSFFDPYFLINSVIHQSLTSNVVDRHAFQMFYLCFVLHRLWLYVSPASLFLFLLFSSCHQNLEILRFLFHSHYP